MSAPAIPPALLDISYLIVLLRDRESELKADLVLKLHTDGSGRIQDNGTDEDRFTFDNFAELASWLNSSRPKPSEPGALRPFHISNPCLGGFHSQCAGVCDCRCHQAEEGIGA